MKPSGQKEFLTGDVKTDKNMLINIKDGEIMLSACESPKAIKPVKLCDDKFFENRVKFEFPEYYKGKSFFKSWKNYYLEILNKNKSKEIKLTGNLEKDQNFLLSLDDRNLFSICIENPKDDYLKKVCSENFWEKRTEKKFNIKEKTQNITWRNFYLENIQKKEKESLNIKDVKNIQQTKTSGGLILTGNEQKDRDILSQTNHEYFLQLCINSKQKDTNAYLNKLCNDPEVFQKRVNDNFGYYLKDPNLSWKNFYLQLLQQEEKINYYIRQKLYLETDYFKFKEDSQDKKNFKKDVSEKISSDFLKFLESIPRNDRYYLENDFIFVNDVFIGMFFGRYSRILRETYPNFEQEISKFKNQIPVVNKITQKYFPATIAIRDLIENKKYKVTIKILDRFLDSIMVIDKTYGSGKASTSYEWGMFLYLLDNTYDSKLINKLINWLSNYSEYNIYNKLNNILTNRFEILKKEGY